MADWNGYIMDISNQFDQGVDDLNQQVEKALEDLANQFLRHEISCRISKCIS
ncbi:type III secretion protein EprI [Escherichia coli]|nr:type III secretion protein EprI [Escherichia coli]